MHAPGALVGDRYRLSQRIGRGRGGVVWIAQDTTVHRTVVVKPRVVELPADTTAMPAPVAAAVQVARRAVKLKHPAAITVYDVVVDAGTIWLVTEYVPSRSMDEFLIGHGKLAAADAAALGGQLASALAAAHRMDLTHQAVEPANVLLADDGGVQITDFGIGTLQPDAAYRAPETIAGGVATAASDVFSLGATLFYAVRGTLPFGPHGVDTGPLLDTGGGVPEPDGTELNQVLVRMMSADPALRPAMSGVASALEAVSAGRPVDPDDMAAAGTPGHHTDVTDAPQQPSLSGTLPVGDGGVRPDTPPQVATLPTTTSPPARPATTTHPTVPATQPTSPVLQPPPHQPGSGPFPAQQPPPQQPGSGPFPAQQPPPQQPGSGPFPAQQPPLRPAAAPRTPTAATAPTLSRGSARLRFLLLVAAILAAAIAGVVFTEFVLL